MTALQPIVGKSLVGETLHRLVEAITSGEFEPGARLSEADLARRLGISRGPLREALSRLEGKLVTRTPNLGVRVIDFSHTVLQQLFLVREALEGMAARLAAERMTLQQIDHLAALLSEHARRPELADGKV